jgi:hypothetical protein
MPNIDRDDENATRYEMTDANNGRREGEMKVKREMPYFVSGQYHGGARGFKKSKRALIREISKLVSDLRLGCAFFPSGNKDCEVLQNAVDRIKADISIKNWGR